MTRGRRGALADPPLAIMQSSGEIRGLSELSPGAEIPLSVLKFLHHTTKPKLRAFFPSFPGTGAQILPGWALSAPAWSSADFTPGLPWVGSGGFSLPKGKSAEGKGKFRCEIIKAYGL